MNFRILLPAFDVEARHKICSDRPSMTLGEGESDKTLEWVMMRSQRETEGNLRPPMSHNNGVSENDKMGEGDDESLERG